MRTLFAISLITFLSFASSAFALPDAEYEKLKSSSTNFRYADGRLNQAWKGLSKKLKKEMLPEQRSWLKTGWDQEAKAYIESGQGRDCAYALPALYRAAVIEAADFNSQVDHPGAEKPDEFFFTERDLGIFEACGADAYDRP